MREEQKASFDQKEKDWVCRISFICKQGRNFSNNVCEIPSIQKYVSQEPSELLELQISCPLGV